MDDFDFVLHKSSPPFKRFWHKKTNTLKSVGLYFYMCTIVRTKFIAISYMCTAVCL